jgi:hypothetical protein
MKLPINKEILVVFILSVFLFSCKTETKTSDKNQQAKDTLQTASGLTYYYTVKGNGRKIEPGSKVSAILSLQVNDSVIWTSYSSKDSLFTYIADRGGVIKGYNEMAMLLREGDDVVAIMPSTIAYGEKGSGKEIPPNATLVYNQFKISTVSEPRLVLSDTLFHTIQKEGVQKMISKYQQLTTKNDSVLYHGGMDQLNGLWRKFNREKMYQEAFDAFSFFSADSEDTTLHFYVIRSLENLGKTTQAMKKIDLVLKGKLSSDQKEYFLKYKQDLANGKK